MNNFISFIGKTALAVIYIEGAMLVNEWLKQAKIDTASKLATINEDKDLDISAELDEIKERLAGLELG